MARLLSEKELTGSLAELTTLYEVSGLGATAAVLLVGLGPRLVRRGGCIFGGLRSGQASLHQASGRGGGCTAPCDEPPLIASALIEGAIAGRSRAWSP